MNKSLKRATDDEAENPPVYKRKTGPANLFIKRKNPRTSDGSTGPVSEKKESVKQRLQRELVNFAAELFANPEQKPPRQ